MLSSEFKNYPYIRHRQKVWKELCKYIQNDTGPVDTLLELAPGYCDFINQFPATRKICYELNPEMQKWAHNSIDFKNASALSIDQELNSSVDLVFASNFFEHLAEDELKIIFPKIYNILKQSGMLVILQPNYDLCKEHYFDDETHKTIFTCNTLCDILGNYGFSIFKKKSRFLPLQMKSKLPKWPFLVRLYLVMPFKPFAGQMYVVAHKKENGYLE